MLSKFRALRDSWLHENATRPRTKAGHESTPSIEIVLSWIAAAWASVPVEIIVNSFVSCGITGNTDSSGITSMTCFKDEGQLADHRQAFLAAFNAKSDNEIEATEMDVDDV